MQKEIGQKINSLRVAKGYTLKDLSEKSNLSIGFLSQAENGLTSLAITSLKKIAEALDKDLNYFFDPPRSNRNMIIRSYEQEVFRIADSRFIHYNLASDIPDRRFVPMVVSILPNKSAEEVIPFTHEGEEFIYVLEGVCTIYINDSKYELYPGDSAHIPSTLPHNWANFTNKMVKILSVHSPPYL
jgi:transcriptional regulator with XRE-family HTH domain